MGGLLAEASHRFQATVELILTAMSDDLAMAWQRFCAGYSMVRFHAGSILDVACDAVVSPANSFGFMDGGVDAVYLKRFGTRLQARVQHRIAEHHGGELLVGSAEIVETADALLPFLIVAPTMRVPMILRDSVNPYLAARAVLRLVRYGVFQHGELAGRSIREHVRRVAFPGLGTGVGQVSANVCARQFAQAIDDVLLERYTMPRTWAEAGQRHQDLTGGRPRRLQSEAE